MSKTRSLAGIAAEGAVELPTGPTANRPDPAVEGMFRRNSETSSFEGYDGASWTGVGGASGGGGNPFVYLNDQIVSVDYTLPAGSNGVTAGPVTIADGVSVTISSGVVWTVV